MSVTQIEVTPQWANYLDLNNDVKPYLQIPTSTTSYDASLQLLVDSECQWVQNYLGRPVAPTQFYRRFSGTLTPYISLPYYPVLAVGSVVEWWGSSGSRTDTGCGVTSGSATVTDAACTSQDVGAHVTGTGIPAGALITAVTPGVSFTMNTTATATGTRSLIVAQGHVLAQQDPWNQGTQDCYQVDWLRGTIIRTFLSLVTRPLFPGFRNVEVTWTAGYNPIPADLKRATLLLIKERWNQEQQASRSPRPAGSTIPQYEPQDGYMLSVMSEVKRYLEPYTQVGIG